MSEAEGQQQRQQLRQSKRRRRRPQLHIEEAQYTLEETKLFQQAVANSKLDQGRPSDGKLGLPFAPTFHPTVEEFEGNPLDYIEKIRPVAQRYGICKIVPPEGWNPKPQFGIDWNMKRKMETKRQFLHRLQEGICFEEGGHYTISEYEQVASHRAKVWKAANYGEDCEGTDMDTSTKGGGSTSTDNEKGKGKKRLYTPENLERDYWSIVEQAHDQHQASKSINSEEEKEAGIPDLLVEYANDIDTGVCRSGFPLSQRGRSIRGTKRLDKLAQPEPKFGTREFYRETYWNCNNIPFAPNSVLRHLKVGINGVNVPWMYYGSLFSTFCWHTEDNYMCSINYHHKGAPKHWYGVPGTAKDSAGLERVFRSFLSAKMMEVPDLLHHITTMFSPRLLQNANIPVSKLVQYEGEYVVTFPRAYHSGFSYGPNIGEAVNFATHDWISFASTANERYRSLARPAVFSHDRLTMTMAYHLLHDCRNGTSASTCKLLLAEVDRIVNEEIRLRQTLAKAGVRDVSEHIELPKNTLEKLDEDSANYDDMRACTCCRHICFFSAVACECSEESVTCLRHANTLCQCSPRRKYFMLWSTDEELKATAQRVRNHYDRLVETEEAANATSESQETQTDDAAGKGKEAGATADEQEQSIAATQSKASELKEPVKDNVQDDGSSLDTEQQLLKFQSYIVSTDPVTKQSFFQPRATASDSQPSRQRQVVRKRTRSFVAAEPS